MVATEAMSYEYAVMRNRERWGGPDELHRGPWPEGEELLWEDWESQSDEKVAAREWCERWIKDSIEAGLRANAFYVARRVVSDWERC